MKRASTVVAAIAAFTAVAGAASRASAQTWREGAAHVGASARVLLIGTRPEDEDNALIAWLSLGHHIETAYLSLTRGESGGNLIGPEREAPLAVVRTAELLAERERDGAHQYFTRAYDFGPTRVDSIVDASWPYDPLLTDVVSVVRAFRPQIVIVVSSRGDESDATRRITARLAADAFAAAADTVRMPSARTSRLPAWTVSRLFTLVDSASPALSSPARVVAVDVGEFDRSSGRSWAEIGAEIRRLQRTQMAPPVPKVGPVQRRLHLDSTRVGDDTTLFGGIDTTLARFHGKVLAEADAQLDTLQRTLAEVRDALSGATPESVAAGLARLAKRTSDVWLALRCGDVAGVSACPGALGDLAVTMTTIRERATRAIIGAAGLVIDGTAGRELVAARDSVPVVATVYNGGDAPMTVHRLAASGGNALSVLVRDSSVVIPPDSAGRWTTTVRVLSPAYHWWQINGLVSGTMLHDFRTTATKSNVPQLISGEDRLATSRIEATVAIGGVDVPIVVQPLVYRSSTVVRGDVHRPLTGVPATSVILERVAEYDRAALPIDRLFRVYLWSARSTADTIAVTLRLPAGLKADSQSRTVALPPFGTRNVFFRLRGKVRAGPDTIAAIARSVATPSGQPTGATVKFGNDPTFQLGFITNEYSHIADQTFVRFAAERLESVDVRVPARMRVAYITGSEDIHVPLGQLQLKVQTLDPSLLSIVDLSAFTTVLIGPDAFANDALAGAIPSLQAFMRNGGTVVVMPGRDEVRGSGLLPYPIVFDSVPRRVSDAGAEVRFTDANSSLLSWPNVITSNDFDGWVGERARDVPASFDPRYRTVLSMGDPHQAPTAATVLVARVGQGTIVYTSLSLDRQLIAVNGGAARLIVNLLAAGMRAEGVK